MAGKKIAGTCYIKIDGEQIEVSGGVEAPLADHKREAVVGAAGVAGFKETTIAPYVKVTAILVSGFPLDKLRDATNMTVTVEFANGSVYTLSDAWFGGESSHKAEEGTADLEFGGVRGQWQ